MNTNDKSKLLELRQKKNAAKKQSELQKHTELVDAINSLHSLFEEDGKTSAESTDRLIEKLSGFTSFRDEVIAVKEAINCLPKIDEVKVSNLSDLISSPQEVDLTPVINAIEGLSNAVQKKTVAAIENKTAEEYIPVRRVIEVRGRLVFDDKPMEVTVVGGRGVSAIASVQTQLTRNGDSVAVVNPDGTPLSGLTISPVYDTILRTDSNDDNITYIGKALPGTAVGDSVWQIARLDENINVDLLYADSGLFTQIFDSRESLTYN